MQIRPLIIFLAASVGVSSLVLQAWVSEKTQSALFVERQMSIQVLASRGSQPDVHSDALDAYWTQVFSFGNLPLVVDLLWMRFLQDDLKLQVPRGTHAPVYYDLDLATQIDTAFLEANHLGATYLTVIRDDFSGALNVLTRAENFRLTQLSKYPQSFVDEYWREAWAIPMALGYVYLFDYQDWDAARAAYEAATLTPGSPVTLKRLVEKLGTVEGRVEVGLRVIRALEVQAERNPALLSQIEKKKKEILELAERGLRK